MHSMPNSNLNANHLKSVLRLNNNQNRLSRLTHENVREPHPLTSSTELLTNIHVLANNSLFRYIKIQLEREV